MDQDLLKRAGVIYGKVAGILTREALAVAVMAGDLPGIITEKAAERIQAAASTLRLRRLEYRMHKCKRKQLAAFTAAGKTMFALSRQHTENVAPEREEDNLLSRINAVFSESRKREEKVRQIGKRIAAIEDTSRRAEGYREAVSNLDSRMRDVRFAAVQMLEQLGDRETIPFMVRKLEDADTRVRRQAAESLHRMIDRMALSS